MSQVKESVGGRTSLYVDSVRQLEQKYFLFTLDDNLFHSYFPHLKHLVKVSNQQLLQ